MNEALEKFIDEANKESIKKYKEKFRKNANRIIDEAEEGLLVISETSIETLGLPNKVIGLLLTALDEIAQTEFNKEWIINNVKLLLEMLENE